MTSRRLATALNSACGLSARKTMTMTQTTGIRREPEAADSAAGASLRAVDWHSIPWKKVSRNVRRLQRRIAQAQQQGQKRKVRALQHILTRSHSARCLAVRRVTENTGSQTPGVDGHKLNTPEKKAQAVENLHPEDYQPQPLLRVHIPKANGDLRPLGIPVMQDRAQQALHLLALDPIAESTADPNSYGFRKARSVADAIAQCFNVLCQATAAQWILEADIKSCFDEISHEWLLSHAPMDRTILRKWLTAGFLEQQVHYPTTTGTPQGGVISPTLMNLALDGLETKLRERYPRHRGAKVHFVRYADDFIITGSSKELLEEEVRPLVTQFLKERGLQLSEKKTRVTHINEGFEFLGNHIRKYNGKLLIKPSRPNVQAFLADIKTFFHQNLHTPVGPLLIRLNPKIRGWAQFHRGTVSKQIFNYVDYRIFRELKHWMRRRHPRKRMSWCYRKYFTTSGSRNYVLEGTTLNRRGKPRRIRMFRAADVPIKRHTKIKADANPYLPEWEPYFEERIARQMKDSPKGYEKLVRLWYGQDGLCPHCGQKITRETGWHMHHRIRLVNGGDDTMANLILLHPVCHQQLHARTDGQTTTHCDAASSEEGE
ncbi:MAG: group II intron reverse transcriptase/maturase [Blastocatellia bacterium]